MQVLLSNKRIRFSGAAKLMAVPDLTFNDCDEGSYLTAAQSSVLTLRCLCLLTQYHSGRRGVPIRLSTATEFSVPTGKCSAEEDSQ